MEYTIVSSETEKNLIEKVNDLIQLGWETEGGVAVSSDGTFYQAMVLIDEEGEEDDFGQGDVV